MPKDTKTLGYIKAPACESRGFVIYKKRVHHFDTPSLYVSNEIRFSYLATRSNHFTIESITIIETAVAPANTNQQAQIGTVV